MSLPLSGAQDVAPQSPIGVRYGNPKAAQVTMVLAVLNTGASSNPATTAVTIDVNSGGAVDVTTLGAIWTAIGTDAPSGHAYNGSQLGWVCNFDITGLNAFGTANSYTVAQSGNGSVSGNLVTAPAAGDDFILYVGTCENVYGSYIVGGQNGIQPQPNEPQATGMYRVIRTFAESPPPNHAPCAGICMVDDVIYADAGFIDDSYTADGGTGHVISDITVSIGAVDTMYIYDYALGYFNHMGMFGDVSTGHTIVDEYHGFEQHWGRNADRLWCQRNLPMMPQMGDHEFDDDFGMAVIDRPTEAAKAAPNRWLGGITCYNAILKPLQGDSIQSASPGDPNANHWATTLGNLRIVSPDGIYNGSGDGAKNSPTTAVTNILDSATAGESQIYDVLTALNTSDEFKILLWPYQFRSMKSDGNREFAGASWSYYDMNLAEFQAMFTESGATPKAWMDNAGLNGTTGKGVVIMGDYHHMHAFNAAAVSYDAGAQLAEDIDVFCVGTITASTNFGFDFDVGSTYRDMEILYNAPEWANLTDGGSRINGFGCARIDVFGSTTPKLMRVRMLDGKYTSGFWQGEWSKDFEV